MNKGTDTINETWTLLDATKFVSSRLKLVENKERAWERIHKKELVGNSESPLTLGAQIIDSVKDPR